MFSTLGPKQVTHQALFLAAQSLHLTLRLFYFSLRFQVERNMSINTVQFENQAKEAKPSMDAMLLYSKIDEENQLEMLSSLGH